VPLLNSFADVFADLERLLAAANANAELLPGLDGAKVPLEQVIADLRSLGTRRDTLNADKQVVTADLQLAVQRGREIASEFRGFARAHIGMRSEKLVEFRIPPRRLGAKAKRGSGLKAKPGQPVPVTEPSPTVAPSLPTGVLTPAAASVAVRPDLEGGAKAQE
jgi:hypothetical protein